MGKDTFELRMNERRQRLMDRIMQIIEPLTPNPSKSMNFEHAARLGTLYVERMRDKKKELEELDRQIEELEKEKQKIRQRWETDEIRFSDL